jgi:hypothetical protein
MITREQAYQIAKKEAQSRKLGFEISSVVTAKEVLSRLGVYVDVSNCWIAYIENTDNWTLQSSIIIAIDKTNGQVRYSGSAKDEG